MTLNWVAAAGLAAVSSGAIGGQACSPLNVPSTAVLYHADPANNYWSYELANGELSGGPGLDDLQLYFYSGATGTFDLSSGANSNFGTCLQCVILYEDFQNGLATKTYFQDMGTLDIGPAPGTNPLPLTFAGLRLIEVTLNPNTGVSTPVPGGACYFGSGGGDLIFASGFDFM